MRIQVTGKAGMQLNDVETKDKLEMASTLRSELSEARKGSHGVPVSTEMAEQPELMFFSGSKAWLRVSTVLFRNNTSQCSSSMTISMRKAWEV